MRWCQHLLHMQPMTLHHTKTNDIADGNPRFQRKQHSQGIDGVLCDKRATINKVIRESETRHEMIEQQLEVEVLGNQIAVDKRKQEIERQCIKEDQERTRTEEQSAWDLENRTREIEDRAHEIENQACEQQQRRTREIENQARKEEQWWICELEDQL